MFKLKIIKTEDEYQNALQYLNELLDEEDLSSDDRSAMELLAHLISEYEEEKYPISLPSPIAAILFRMEQMNLKQADLVPYIGSKSKVSDILNGKRPLSLNMIRSLHSGLGIPLEALITQKEMGNTDRIDNIDWDKFPVKAMYELGKSDYFPNVRATYQQIKSNFVDYFRSMIEPIQKLAFSDGLFRQNIRMGGQEDKYALAAWVAACYNKARQEELPNQYDPDKFEIIVNQLRALSVLDEGPLQAINFLNKVGMHVVILHHLPKTHLDGATFISEDDNPVIALTLRYDRIDYFWFTLFHELGHINFHLFNDGKQDLFIDDLQLRTSDLLEEQADDFASEALISDRELQESGLFEDCSPANVINVANQKYIHPAIIAGRLRHHFNNFYILSNLVGNGCVRQLFKN
jgi:HTH-type transcriptional regulator / antitoxin HigA